MSRIEIDDIDVGVKYGTKEDKLKTETLFDLPDDVLTVESIDVPDQSSLDVSGTYTKSQANLFANSSDDTRWFEEEIVYNTLYEKLFPQKNFADYLDYPISGNVIKDLYKDITKFDRRYGLMVENIKTVKDLIQFLVNFRYRRFNILDNYIRFTDYADMVRSILSQIRISSKFPIFINGKTVLKQQPKQQFDKPYYTDLNGGIVYTNDYYEAQLIVGNRKITRKSLSYVNYSINNGENWLITNHKDYLLFTSINGVAKQINFNYNVDMVTGVRYKGDNIILYLLSNYTEHSVIMDKSFNIIEDTVQVVFNSDIIQLMDPKTIIFRDEYQYYVNEEDGTIHTFALIDMVDNNNNIIKQYNIHKTTLDEPMPISITDDGPRISNRYSGMYMQMFAYGEDIDLMVFYPAFSYEFDKYSFYNPRKYLTSDDYNEACIPLHGGFKRTRVYPLFWGSPGFTWTNGHYYRHHWNSYWGFFWDGDYGSTWDYPYFDYHNYDYWR